MRKAKKAALDVLAKAADVYNCWEILDEAVTSSDRDAFTQGYIADERMMLADEIAELQQALVRFGRQCGIRVNACCVDVMPWRAEG